VLLGAIFIAPLADRVGRRRIMTAACIAFGLCTLATLTAGSLTTLLPLRLLTGLGLGAAIPNAIALASEYAPKRWRATTVMFVASGLSVGSVVAGIAAARLIPTVGWPAIFLIGGVLPLLLAAALGRWLPESLRFLAALHERQADARRWFAALTGTPVAADARFVADDAEAGKATVVDLFKERRARSTVLLCRVLHEPAQCLPHELAADPPNASGFSVSDAAVHVDSSPAVAGIHARPAHGSRRREAQCRPFAAAAGFHIAAMMPHLSYAA
jgi:AAHS family 4-hydroxybenzoate transporter-like MFS transporter